MTTYTNNTRLQVIPQYLKDQPWFKGQVIGNAGNFPLPKMREEDMHVQLDKIISRAAKIKKGLHKEFPNTSKTDMKSMTRTLHWFNGLIDWTDSEYNDYKDGDMIRIEETKAQIDAVNYQYDQDLEAWYVGYSTTFANDVDSTEFWIPWFHARTEGDSSMNDPADMNSKVTNVAGTTGTTGVALNMGTVLSSLTTSQTIDFVRQTFQPIIRAFTAFKDTNNGRRMVESRNSYSADSARYVFMAAPELIEELYSVKTYDGEKVRTDGPSVGQVMEAKKIKLVPCDDYSAGLAEEAGGGEGKCEFGFVCDFNRNFQIGVERPVTWEADKEIPDINSKWVKKMTSRHLPFNMPYWSGSYYYKAYFHGYFTYQNDTP